MSDLYIDSPTLPLRFTTLFSRMESGDEEEIFELEDEWRVENLQAMVETLEISRETEDVQTVINIDNYAAPDTLQGLF